MTAPLVTQLFLSGCRTIVLLHWVWRFRVYCSQRGQSGLVLQVIHCWLILPNVRSIKTKSFRFKVINIAKHSFAGDVLISTVSGRWKLYEIDSDNNVYGDEYDGNEDDNVDSNNDDDGDDVGGEVGDDDDVGGDVGDDDDFGDWRLWQRKASVASLMLAKSLSQWRSTWLYIIIIIIINLIESSSSLSPSSLSSLLLHHRENTSSLQKNMNTYF